METYQDELNMFKRWMRKQNFNTLEELTALVIFGDYGYAEAVRRIKAAQQSVRPTGGESAPLPALSTPEVDSIGGADTTPPAAQ